jgi:hypothetical protein
MPSHPIDYFVPKVGGKDKYGNDNRLVPPDYVKDAMHLAHSPKDYALSSLSRLVGGIRDWARGYDYYGEEVSGPGGLLKAFAPTNIAVSSFKAGQDTGQDPTATALSLVGVSKAPGWATRTPMQNRAMEVAYRSPFVRTHEQAQLSQKMSQAEMLYRNTGKMSKGLSAAQTAKVIQKAGQDRVKEMIKRASYPDALYIMDAASPDELTKYWDLVPPKALTANVPDEQMPALKRQEDKIAARVPKAHAHAAETWTPEPLWNEGPQVQ